MDKADQMEKLTNPANYRLPAAGFLAELDRMNLEVRDCLWLHAAELKPDASPVGA